MGVDAIVGAVGRVQLGLIVCHAWLLAALTSQGQAGALAALSRHPASPGAELQRHLFAITQPVHNLLQCQ